MSTNSELQAIIRSQLVRDRSLSARNASAIATHLSVEDPLLGFKPGVLSHREEYELDLMFSPLFTPDMEDRAACEPFLPLPGLPRPEWEGVITQFAAEELQSTVFFGSDQTQFIMPEVVIERHVRLLRLGDAITSRAAVLLSQLAEPATLNLARSYARSRIWRDEPAAEMLCQCLEAMAQRVSFSMEKLAFLCEFVRTYHPANRDYLVGGLQNLLESYRIDHERPVFNQQLEDHQANAIRSQYCDATVQAYRVRMARALLEDF